MKNLLNVLVLTAVAVFCAACGSPAKDQTPDEFVRAYYSAVSDSPEKAISLTTFASADKEMGLMGLKQSQANYKRLGGLAAVEEIKFNESTSAYSAKLRFNNGTTAVDKGFLVKKNGEWKYTPFRPQ